MNEKIKVYIKVDERNLVTEINSSVFINEIGEWIKIDEGDGDKYSHAQNNYLPSSLIDGQGRNNYKLIDGKVIALTDEKKETLFPILPEQQTDTELFMEIALDHEERLSIIELMGGTL